MTTAIESEFFQGKILAALKICSLDFYQLSGLTEITPSLLDPELVKLLNAGLIETFEQDTYLRYRLPKGNAQRRRV
jgi:hypothetical protein